MLLYTAVPAYAAWALIPDDDDEDLVEKAKAKRSQKLKEELGTQKKFARRQAGLLAHQTHPDWTADDINP